MELEGSPDLVIEVVSSSSVEKDTIFLRQAYAEGGILEYWLLDGRKGSPTFELLKLGKKGYIASRPFDGWVWSEVLQHSFRLTQSENDDGFPIFTLETSMAKQGKK